MMPPQNTMLLHSKYFNWRPFIKKLMSPGKKIYQSVFAYTLFSPTNLQIAKYIGIVTQMNRLLRRVCFIIRHKPYMTYIGRYKGRDIFCTQKHLITMVN